MSTDLNLGIGGMKKASPEALSLMMANLRNNSNQRKAWKPNNKMMMRKDSKKVYY